MLIYVALGIAFIVPLLFLYFVRKFDLFATGRYAVNFVTLIWGIIAYLLAVQVNSGMITQGFATRTQVIQIWAPIVEEILKSIILIYLVSRADFNYIVDGAIYGFGA